MRGRALVSTVLCLKLAVEARFYHEADAEGNFDKYKNLPGKFWRGMPASMRRLCRVRPDALGCPHADYHKQLEEEGAVIKKVPKERPLQSPPTNLNSNEDFSNPNDHRGIEGRQSPNGISAAGRRRSARPRVRPCASLGT